MKIAIIGTGISGLTAAYLLSRNHNITVFESNKYVGGHTHTHEIDLGGKKWAVDTGFIVYNERTYPNFIKLLDLLKVELQITSMGFSVKSAEKNLEYHQILIFFVLAHREWAHSELSFGNVHHYHQPLSMQ